MQSDENLTFDKPDAEDNYENAIGELTSGTWLPLWIVLIFAAFLVIDVLVPQKIRDSTFVFFILLNIVVAQLTLICIWGTLVEGTFWVRIPWTLLLLVASWAALVYGVFLGQDNTVDPREVLGLGFVWFLGFAASYAPLKIAAWLFGWRITQAKSLQPNPNANRYAIRDMMIGTAILAMVMSIGRFLVPGELPSWSAVIAATELNRPEQVFVMLTFSIVSLIVKLPCIWIALATKSANLVSRSAKWIILSGLIGLAEFALLSAVLGAPGPDLFEVCAAVALGHAAMAAVMISVLCVLRGNGYGITRIVKRTKIGH